MPRSAIIWARSRKLSLNVMCHLTHRMMISWSKCRPLNRSCTEVGSVIPAVIAGYRAFQQFAPEPSDASGRASTRSKKAGASRSFPPRTVRQAPGPIVMVDQNGVPLARSREVTFSTPRRSIISASISIKGRKACSAYCCRKLIQLRSTRRFPNRILTHSGNSLA
jgi:hypothetical protein